MTEKNMSVEELAMGERKFLHDLANHIVVAHGMLTLLQRSVEEGKSLEEKDVERVEKAMAAVTRMSTLLKERRGVLHSVNGQII